jgi:hypothetical protein
MIAMPEEFTFAHRLANALKVAKAANCATWNNELWLKTVNEVYALERVTKQRKPKGAPRDRNPLFDALAIATGTRSLDQLTRVAAKAIAVALADILKVTPGLTVTEIQRRAAAYKRRWPDTRNLSAPALAKHWGQFAPMDGEASTDAAGRDVYQEPKEWHAAAVALHGADIAAMMKERGWMNIGTDFRTAILAEIRKNAPVAP